MPLIMYVILAALVGAIFVAYNKGKKSVVIPAQPVQKPSPKPIKLGFREAESILDRANINSVDINSENIVLIGLTANVLGVENTVKADAEKLITQMHLEKTESEEAAKEAEENGTKEITNLENQIERLKENITETKRNMLENISLFEDQVEAAKERITEMQKIADLF